jgi:hypothetical protein
VQAADANELVAALSGSESIRVALVGMADPRLAMEVRMRVPSEGGGHAVPILMACDPACGPDAKAKAGLCGFDRLYPWPHAALSHVARLIAPVAGLKLRQRAPRVIVEEAPPYGTPGTLVDISAQGALFRFEASGTPPRLIRLDLRVLGHAETVTVIGKRVRSAATARGQLVGVRFVQVTPGGFDVLAKLKESVDYFPCGAAASTPKLVEPIRIDICHEREATVIFHRVDPEEPRLRLLRRSNVHVHRVRSIEKVVELAKAATGLIIVVFDLGRGSSGPERLHRELWCPPPAESFPSLILGTSVASENVTRRKRALGLSAVYRWPDALLHELFEILQVLPTAAFKRLSRRTTITTRLVATAQQLNGRFVNISPGGAMVESADPSATGEFMLIELDVERSGNPAKVKAEVVWTERSDEKHRIGLRFDNLPDETRRSLEDYVASMSTVSGAKKARSLNGRVVKVQAVGKRRSDYFMLTGDVDEEALLVPRRAFLPPYRVGEILVVRDKQGDQLRVELLGRLMVDGDRIDSRVGWRIRRIVS